MSAWRFERVGCGLSRNTEEGMITLDSRNLKYVAAAAAVSLSSAVGVFTTGCSSESGNETSGGDALAAKGKKPRCGDGVCNGKETCATCPQDCGACSVGA